ncbi:MAG: RcnB family protein [Acinetobacter sp.]|nr:RcnB family protein [Acinetobacter sp.]
MNTFIKAAILSISTAWIALPAQAAPQEQHQQHHAAQSYGHAQQHTSNGHQQPTQATVKKAKRPSQDWKAGQKLPSVYHSNAYKVDHQKYKKLSKPGKNQQWIKVNGDYVLTDIRNHSIIKIIAG